MMPETSLVGVLIVAAVAFVVPLILGPVPALRVPSLVSEIVAGVIIGPAVLGLVEVDDPLQFMALVGLAFLLLLQGWRLISAACCAAGRYAAPVSGSRYRS
jgi:Kef-type K+ transport system membrane component KefB